MIGIPTSQISSDPPTEKTVESTADETTMIPSPSTIAIVAHQLVAWNGDRRKDRTRAAGRPDVAVVAGLSAVPVIGGTLAPEGRGPGSSRTTP